MATTKEALFFLIIFFQFYLGFRLTDFWIGATKVNRDIAALITALIVTLVTVGIYYLVNGKHKDNYRAFEISPGAMCRGGPYMWQGDSERAKMCRKLASTPEGRYELSKFNCPNGFNGLPKVPLEFSSNSDSCWRGVNCSKNNNNNQQPCSCSMCSMVVGQQ